MPDGGGGTAGGPSRLVAGGPAAGPPPVRRVAARAAAAFVNGAPVRLARHKLHRQRPCVACQAVKHTSLEVALRPQRMPRSAAHKLQGRFQQGHQRTGGESSQRSCSTQGQPESQPASSWRSCHKSATVQACPAGKYCCNPSWRHGPDLSLHTGWAQLSSSTACTHAA